MRESQSDHLHEKDFDLVISKCCLGQENVQVSSVQMRLGLRNSQEPPVDHQALKTPLTGAQNTGVSRSVLLVKKEFLLPKVPLPSFIQRLVVFNIQDTAGNTSGGRFVSF